MAAGVAVGHGASVGMRVGSSPGAGVGVRGAGPWPSTGATGFESQKSPVVMSDRPGSIRCSLRTSSMTFGSSGWMNAITHGL